MSKNKSLIYISISVLIIIILSLSFYILRANDKASRAIPIDLATLDPDLYDQSWLTGVPCAAPCWYGLKPGETTKENTMTVVSKLPFVDSSAMQGSSTNVYFPSKIQHDNLRSGIVVTFEDAILEGIYIMPGYPITIEQAVEKLGNPDGLSVNIMDPYSDRLYIIWSKKQLILEHTEPNTVILFMTVNESLNEKIFRNNGKIPKDLFVEIIIYTTPYQIERYMRGHGTWKGFVVDH